MNNGLWIVTFLFGILSGATGTWLFLRGKSAEASAAAAAELAALRERVAAGDREKASLEDRLSAERLGSESLQTQLVEEKQTCAKATERAGRAAAAEQRIEELTTQNTALTAQLEGMRKQMIEQQRAAEEKLGLVNEAREKLSDVFKALCSDALKSNNQSFLDLAQQAMATFAEGARGDLEQRKKAVEELIRPMRESLASFDLHVKGLEKERVTAYTELKTQIESLSSGQNALQQQTQNLVRALRRPEVRGRWGEIQLRRTVELAGMVDHCDFAEQQSTDVDGGRLRPDMIIHLPNHRDIVVDSKAPLDAYLQAVEATDEAARAAHLENHAKQIREHLKKLSAKAYADQFESAPDFVVLFLPGEAFFSAALDRDPGLIEQGIAQNVIISTPTTLIALLKAVAYGWKQELIAERAQEISNLGAELYDRLCTMSEHFAKVGARLGGAVDSYNKAVASLESRVLVSARKFREHGIAAPKEMETLEQVERIPRMLVAAKQEEESNGGETETPES